MSEMNQFRALFDEVHDGENDEKNPGYLSAIYFGLMIRDFRVFWIRRVKVASHGAGDVVAEDRDAQGFEDQHCVDGVGDAVDQVSEDQQGVVQPFDLRPFELKKRC